MAARLASSAQCPCCALPSHYKDNWHRHERQEEHLLREDTLELRVDSRNVRNGLSKRFKWTAWRFYRYYHSYRYRFER